MIGLVRAIPFSVLVLSAVSGEALAHTPPTDFDRFGLVCRCKP